MSFEFSSIIALFGAMTVLATLPSVSVFTVVAAAAQGGFRSGAWTTLGIVLGDLLLILLAVFGLTLLVESLGNAFAVVQYLGGAYLITIGCLLWRSTERSRINHDSLSATEELEPTETISMRTSSWGHFITGLAITLGDQKAVLFYLGFLPAFVDLKRLTTLDILLLMAIAALAVGGVKLGYVYLASRARLRFGQRLGVMMNRVAAVMMIMVGLVVIFRS
jgi:threonine/homoserine/homoserine lactone efflux protein